MATPPTRVTGVTPAVGWNSTASPKTSPTFDVQSGDLIVLLAFSEDGAVTLAAPSWTGTGTWTLQQSVVVANYCTAYLYTCPVTATATGVTISQARSGGTALTWSFYASVWRNHGGLGVTGKTNVASGAPSLTLSTSANSAVVCGNSDWNATSPTGHTWRTVNGAAMTETSQGGNAGVSYETYSGYAPDTGAAGSTVVGLTAPSQKYSIVGAEVLGTASSSAFSGTVALAGAGSVTGAGTPTVSGSAPVSGAGSLAGVGKPAVTGSAIPSGSGTLATIGTPATNGQSNPAGAGTLTLSSTVTVSGALNLTGAGTLTLSGTASGAANGSLALTGTGALTLTGTPGAAATLSLAGTGTLTLSGAAGGNGAGTVNLSAAGTLAGAGNPATTGATAPNGNAALALAGTPTTSGTLTLTGSGTLTGTGQPAGSGALTLTGTGTLTLNGQPLGLPVDLTLTVTTIPERWNLASLANRWTTTAIPERWTLTPLEDAMTTIIASAGGKKYVGGTITETTGKNISTATILIGLSTSNTAPPLTAGLPDLDTPGATNSVRTVKQLVSNTTPAGVYWPWVKISDNPETDWLLIPEPVTIT